ncbi:MAG: methyltransferase [Gammaproteobacteria bacterium]|nr:methyltransferase [Gammaproteobacteria bacterium]MDH3858536.1 methyltransferase [Gammaproteobacteria bacterium]
MNKPLSIDSQKLLLVPQGEFELVCNPRDELLQAWDSADEFLLNYLDEIKVLSRHGKLLILNDTFGALAVALANHPVYSWNDSYLAQQALRDNLTANGYPVDQVKTNQGINFPTASVDCVLIKIPKALALLEHQLYALRRVLHHDTHIFAAGMARNIHRSTLDLFETILGPTTTTRARKKSRLILVERDQSLNEGQSPYPDSYELQVDRIYRIINHASLFSRDRLDRGSQLLLENMPVADRFRRIVDLGCGNGVIGIIAAALNSEASMLFCDESYMAIASAEDNFRNAFAGSRAATFRVGDGLQGVDSNRHDLVLINPPFHQQHGVGDATAWQMFRQAQRVLTPGGELRIVGNRHMAYHSKLKKLFGNCETIASDSKFVVLSSTKHK